MPYVDGFLIPAPAWRPLQTAVWQKGRDEARRARLQGVRRRRPQVEWWFTRKPRGPPGGPSTSRVAARQAMKERHGCLEMTGFWASSTGDLQALVRGVYYEHSSERSAMRLHGWRLRGVFLSGACGVVALGSASLGADDWPEWRGRGRLANGARRESSTRCPPRA